MESAEVVKSLLSKALYQTETIYAASHTRSCVAIRFPVNHTLRASCRNGQGCCKEGEGARRRKTQVLFHQKSHQISWFTSWKIDDMEPLLIYVWKMIFLFNWVICRFRVIFEGCNLFLDLFEVVWFIFYLPLKGRLSWDDSP